MGHINESEYVQICQQVQAFLRPINIARNLFRSLYVASISLFGLAVYVSFKNSVATLSTVVALAIVLVLVGFFGPLLIIPPRTKKAFQSIKSLCNEQSSRFNNDSVTESFEVNFHLCDGLNVTPKNFEPDDHTFSSFKTYHNIYVSIDVKNKHFLSDLEIGSSSSLLKENDRYASEWTLESILSKDDDDSHTVSTIDIDYDTNNDDFDGKLVERSSSSRSDGNKKTKRKTRKKRKKSRRYETQYEPSDLEKELRDILKQQEQEDKGKSKRNKGKATRRKSRRRSVDDDPSIV